jgi:hypothetical protein
MGGSEGTAAADPDGPALTEGAGPGEGPSLLWRHPTSAINANANVSPSFVASQLIGIGYPNPTRVAGE